MNEQQWEFLWKEFGIPKEQFSKLTDAELEKLYEKLQVIEEIESVKCEDTEMSVRGDIAISLVDYLYAYSIA